MTRARSVAADQGFATVLASFAILGLLSVVLLLVQVGAAVSARHAAQSAADLAALAAASALERGTDSACAAAATIAERMRAQVSDCEVQEWDVVVTVAARVALASFGRKEVSATARAGPAGE